MVEIGDFQNVIFAEVLAGWIKLLSNCHHRSILILFKMDDIELAVCASFCLLGLVFTPKLDRKPCIHPSISYPYVQSIAKQASQIVGSHLRDTLHLRPFCTSIKPPSAHVWSTAPILGVVLCNRVALICLIGSRGGW